MSVLASAVRRGAYADSIVLMRMQGKLAELPGVLNAGVVMGTRANLDLLRAGGLGPEDPDTIGADDLVVAVCAEDDERARAALDRVDELLAARGSTRDDGEIHPRSLRQALRRQPQARWALVSTPGRFAGRVAREALDRGLHVFLYSDNVPLAEEVALKRQAARHGRLVLGPDCGTTIVGGVGLGFANRVRRGAVGLVCASGTGLQAIACHVHELGSGVSHGLGTGGRDLVAEVGGITAHQALDLLARDPETAVIVLASKPPDPSVGAGLLAFAARLCKPVVVHFSGRAAPVARIGDLHFARSLEEAAELAVALCGPGARTGRPAPTNGREEPEREPPAPRRFLRGLFAGGTLALEALHGLAPLLAPIASNLAAPGAEPLDDPATSRGHTLLDLGADELTVGRLHPMIDPRLRVERLRREAADPEVAALVLDVVLGLGAEADPAATLAPEIARIAAAGGPAVIVVVVGTDEDPQDRDATEARLAEAGAVVSRSLSQAVARAAALCWRPAAAPGPPVDAAALTAGFAAINVGLPSFHDDLVSQGVASVHVDWRPPAGGDERLLSILERMRS